MALVRWHDVAARVGASELMASFFSLLGGRDLREQPLPECLRQLEERCGGLAPEQFRRVPWSTRDQSLTLVAFEPQDEAQLALVGGNGGSADDLRLQADGGASGRSHHSQDERVGGAEQAQGEPDEAEHDGDTHQDWRDQVVHLQDHFAQTLHRDFSLGEGIGRLSTMHTTPSALYDKALYHKYISLSRVNQATSIFFLYA